MSVIQFAPRSSMLSAYWLAGLLSFGVEEEFVACDCEPTGVLVGAVLPAPASSPQAPKRGTSTVMKAAANSRRDMRSSEVKCNGSVARPPVWRKEIRQAAGKAGEESVPGSGTR